MQIGELNSNVISPAQAASYSCGNAAIGSVSCSGYMGTIRCNITGSLGINGSAGCTNSEGKTVYCSSNFLFGGMNVDCPAFPIAAPIQTPTPKPTLTFSYPIPTPSKSSLYTNPTPIPIYSNSYTAPSPIYSNGTTTVLAPSFDDSESALKQDASYAAEDSTNNAYSEAQIATKAAQDALDAVSALGLQVSALLDTVRQLADVVIKLKKKV